MRTDFHKKEKSPCFFRATLWPRCGSDLSIELTLKIKVVCTEPPGIRFGEATAAASKPEFEKSAAQGKSRLLKSVAACAYEPVDLTIRRKKQTVIEQSPANRKRATFLAEIRMGKTADGSPDFLGGLAQWTTADRFFCLSGGVKKSGQFRMFQRLKIRLGL